jgi:hypothetical protein
MMRVVRLTAALVAPAAVAALALAVLPLAGGPALAEDLHTLLVAQPARGAELDELALAVARCQEGKEEVTRELVAG